MLHINTHLIKTNTNRLSTSLSSESKQQKMLADKPTPLNFDKFVPWVCMEWELPEVVTVRKVAQKKRNRADRLTSSIEIKSIRTSKQYNEEYVEFRSTSNQSSLSTTSLFPHNSDKVVTIKAFYDQHGNLTQIAIGSCESVPHRRIIQAISLCIPFHHFLTKLVIDKNVLDQILLHEISKLLPRSHLSDICLDDTVVPEGNYYELLDCPSNLKYLSLKRCDINDEVCKKIASRIDFGGPGEKSLAILDLSTNCITDIGAKYFGDMLRKNRHLLHLNLSGNSIGDEGFLCLIKHLKEFRLTHDEISDPCFREKSELNAQCMKGISRLKKYGSRPSEKRLLKNITNIDTKNNKSIRSKNPEPVLTSDPAEEITNEILGDLKDKGPFNDNNCIKKCGHYYSVGNLKFCSLNVAYNNIDFLSLQEIKKVLKYQCTIKELQPNTGLIRIILEGNYLPISCRELEWIDMYLRNACHRHI